ncbi:MAG: MBL fold metallo-hydrolase, partial [Clostridiaceae bacterium]|nr:MBL fold metallo-hydrolase [Clostridiaceae bacterium]
VNRRFAETIQRFLTGLRKDRIKMSRKEQVKKAIYMKGPDYVPLMYSATYDDSDIINVPVEKLFLGPDKDITEWGFRWDYTDRNLTFGQPKTITIETWEDLKNYKAPDPFDNSRFDLMKELRKKYGDERYYKANFMMTGLSTITMLRGFGNTMEDMYINRDEFEKFADIVFGFEENIIRQLRDYGFDAMGLCDDYGSQRSLFMNPNIWRELIKPRLKKQIDLSHECGLDTYLHSCGYIYDIIPDLIEIGLDILNPGQPSLNGIKRLGENFGGKICFACPVSYQTTGISGTKEEIYNEIKDYVDYLGCFNGGLIGIINEDITALGAPTDNQPYIIDTYKTLGRYKPGHQIEMIWLGQAGFLIKDNKGNSVAIDAYLTDSCERLIGFKRLAPSIMRPDELKADLFLATHNHADHLDADAVPVIMEGEGTVLAGPGSVIADCEGMGIDKNRLKELKPGEEIRHKDISVKAVYADHDELAPDAIGFLLEVGGIRIYFTGDTSYCPEKLTDAIDFKPDIIIPPINGAYGNLDSEEAARLAGDTGAKVVIPCHFWTFREHGGNPQAFFEAMKIYAPGCEVKFLTPGEVYKYNCSF